MREFLLYRSINGFSLKSFILISFYKHSGYKMRFFNTEEAIFVSVSGKIKI
jgi:hypothetical protein